MKSPALFWDSFKKYGIWLIIVALLICNIALLKQNFQLRSQLEFYQPQNLKIGDRVQNFSGKNLNGEIIKIDFSDTSKKRFLLYFTPTCKYCKQQFPEWKDLISQAKDKNIEVFGVVSENENKEAIENYLNSLDCGTSSATPLQLLFIPNETLRNYKLSLTPTTILLSGNGIVEQNWIGKWKETDKNLALNLLDQ